MSETVGKRVLLLAGSGAGYFKPGQYGYVIAVNKTGGMHYSDGHGVSKKGQAAYLIAKTKGAVGGAIWFHSKSLRFAKR